jgi:hypothetical protein
MLTNLELELEFAADEEFRSFIMWVGKEVGCILVFYYSSAMEMDDSMRKPSCLW